MKKIAFIILIAAFGIMAKAQNEYEKDNCRADLSVTWQDVQKLLKPDEAVIEFATCYPANTQQTNSVLYVALVLRPDMDAPVWIPLCEEKDLQACFDRTKSISNNRLDVDWLKTHVLYNLFGNELYNLIWQPLEKELADVEEIYYSLTGLLNQIAFNALPVGNDNRTLLDTYNLKLVSGIREIARISKETTQSILQDTAVIYGGLTYDAPSDAERQSRSGAWLYTPGTKIETEAIVKLLESRHIPCKYYTEDQGTEESFKQLSGTNAALIHVSTHGYFLSDLESLDVADIQRLGVDKENLMSGSGLIMSGTNATWMATEIIMDQGKDDGILTADEISRINLKHTKLAVLAGSVTGLGYVTDEGVFGLQRAFKLAGVESLIMSLWDVDDMATQIMMITFYTNLIGGKTRQEAFRTAQKAVREYAENDFSSPYYWAAFVMMD